MYRALLSLLDACGHVTLYTDNVYVHYVDRHIRFVLLSRSQYTLRRESSSDPILLGLPKFILYAHLISHFIVL